MKQPGETRSPGLGYESGGYAPFLTDSLSIQARAASLTLSDASNIFGIQPRFLARMSTYKPLAAFSIGAARMSSAYGSGIR